MTRTSGAQTAAVRAALSVMVLAAGLLVGLPQPSSADHGVFMDDFIEGTWRRAGDSQRVYEISGSGGTYNWTAASNYTTSFGCKVNVGDFLYELKNDHNPYASHDWATYVGKWMYYYYDSKNPEGDRGDHCQRILVNESDTNLPGGSYNYGAEHGFRKIDTEETSENPDGQALKWDCAVTGPYSHCDTLLRVGPGYFEEVAEPTPTPTPSPSPTEEEEERLPIVFVPGFLGSKIVCGADEVWPNLPNPRFKDMRLADDGDTNFQEGSPCNKKARASGEIVGASYGYKRTVEYLEGLPRKVSFYGYDWRRSPLAAVAGLNRKVNAARAQAGTDKVVLMAHSMGGLVARAYVDAYPAKVERVVTIGTPFLGAPKPWLALAHGFTTPESNSLDRVISNSDLKLFARNSSGAYFLYPSEAYIRLFGGWLTYAPLGGNEPLDSQEVLAAVDVFAGNSALLEQAYSTHASLLETYPSGVDWQMVVGTGIQTLTHVDEPSPRDDPGYTYGNGDGTVPLGSAAMGFVNPSAVHFVCGAEHGGLSGDFDVGRFIRPFLLRGESIDARDEPCNAP